MILLLTQLPPGNRSSGEAAPASLGVQPAADKSRRLDHLALGDQSGVLLLQSQRPGRRQLHRWLQATGIPRITVQHIPAADERERCPAGRLPLCRGEAGP